MTEQDQAADYGLLRSNVSLLGRLLGETIASAEGDDFLALIETIRTRSKAARGGSDEDRQALLDTLANLDNSELVPVARAFSQFLNLANIADQQFMVSRSMDEVFSASRTLATTLQKGRCRPDLVI